MENNKSEQSQEDQEKWWYASGGKRIGPVSSGEIKQLILDFKINKDTLVWSESLKEWKKLSAVQALAEVATLQPPELPLPHSDESIQKKAAKIQGLENEEYGIKIATPWRRLGARLIDLWIFGLLFGLIVFYFGSRVSTDFALWLKNTPELTIGWAFFPFVLGIEGVVIGVFGSTLGKMLLGVSVKNIDGSNPTIKEHLKRLSGVYWSGMGTGLPVICLIPMVRQYYRLKSMGATVYDGHKFVVYAKDIGALRWLTAGILMTSLVLVQLFAHVAVKSTGEERGKSNSSELSSASLAKLESQENIGINSKPRVWKNVETDKAVEIPRGWSYGKDDVWQSHVFQDVSAGLSIEFTSVFNLSDDIVKFSDSWIKFESSQRGYKWESSSVRSVKFGEYVGLMFSGSKEGSIYPYSRAILIMEGKNIWILVSSSDEQQKLESQRAVELGDLLLDSIR